MCLRKRHRLLGAFYWNFVATNLDDSPACSQACLQADGMLVGKLVERHDAFFQLLSVFLGFDAGIFVRSDGMIQSGPDPVSETAVVNPIAPKRVA
jgi:hypothetical protein